jgi:hypothetical protein
MSGDADILVQARSAVLDALDALEDHRESVVVIGAQAIYLHTGSAQVAWLRQQRTATSPWTCAPSVMIR